jgi:hypothetical protein
MIDFSDPFPTLLHSWFPHKEGPSAVTSTASEVYVLAAGKDSAPLTPCYGRAFAGSLAWHTLASKSFFYYAVSF